MRVDAVITWVNGNDPVWRQKRERSENGNLASTLSTSNVEGRYRDNGELKFLLRSIEQFWPFQGNIFIVTDNQRPEFLNDNPRIKIIDHTQILDECYLPTFSSRVIESALHKIPGLSEHFVAFNDDVFLSRHVQFDDFFGEKGSRVYLTNERLPEVNSVGNLAGGNDALNAKLWMIEHYGESKLDYLPEHTPKGIKKGWMQELETLHPDMFHEVRSEKFRRVFGQSILANVYPDWCATSGRSDIRYDQSLYLYTDHVEQRDVSAELMDALGVKLSVCINDTTDNRIDLDDLHEKLDLARNACFPEASMFEREPVRVRQEKALHLYSNQPSIG
jgi:hypothetical protein